MLQQIRNLTVAVVLAVLLLSRADGGASEKLDVIELLREAQKNCDLLQDYTVTFHKQQRVGGTLHDEEKIFVKFKKPFMVYMKWTGDVENGREALYVKGKHNDKLVAHLGGMINYFAPAFSLHPSGRLAMRRNLRPITESGVGNTTKLLLEVCEKARKNKDLEAVYQGEGNVGGRKTLKFERLLPQKEGYPAHRTLIEIDAETKIPLSVTSYGWKGELLEKYRYIDLKPDVGLTESDFDKGNREYGFGYIVVPVPLDM